jgi:hypothetical protein
MVLGNRRENAVVSPPEADVETDLALSSLSPIRAQHIDRLFRPKSRYRTFSGLPDGGTACAPLVTADDRHRELEPVAYGVSESA